MFDKKTQYKVRKQQEKWDMNDKQDRTLKNDRKGSMKNLSNFKIVKLFFV